MSELKEILEEIETLRKNLAHLIEKKQGDLQDMEIINASRILDSVLNEYNKLIESKVSSYEE